MRKLATVRKIDALEPIDGADLIETAVIGGWKVVVKKGEFSVGQLAVYFEIDSWIPNVLAPFLTNENKEPREYNGIKGERLRTVRLRKQISQGLLLPIRVVYDGVETKLKELGVVLEAIPVIIEEDMDVSDLLNIHKYEPPMPTQLAGMAKGNFPSFIPKTDEERVQNLSRSLYKWASSDDYEVEISEKIDGSSMTVYAKDSTDEQGAYLQQFGVCSRNLELKETEGNSFWAMANSLDLRNKLAKLGRNIAIQGELFGTGINGNHYRSTEHRFWVFSIYDINKGEYLNSNDRIELCKELELEHVPVLGYMNLRDQTIDGLLAMAEGKSVVNPIVEREGVVLKCVTNPQIHFKCISNLYLLKEK